MYRGRRSILWWIILLSTGMSLCCSCGLITMAVGYGRNLIYLSHQGQINANNLTSYGLIIFPSGICGIIFWVVGMFLAIFYLLKIVKIKKLRNF